MEVMAYPEAFVAAARQYLASGKKRKPLSRSLCLNLAAQILAVDSGLKPALLYDTNSAGPDKIQQYLHTLGAFGLVANALHVVVVDDNTLIVNLDLIILHLEELLLKKNISVMDVSQSRAQPMLTNMESSGAEESVQGILGDLRKLTQGAGRGTPEVLTVGEGLCGHWNLCTLFGILLGFPATYWFDQKMSFENCLSMMPLLVTTATASWDAVAGGSRHCFYSFSIPQVLMSETQPMLDSWAEKLHERFSHQSTFSALTVSTETVLLPSVAL
ncbi:UPF0739 protein C1orf74 homolog [Megalops cyprinoides]|uniref:UPF0739 protein C1orf74 homolog n=1 Tax=Megalops cyprinoides TaxID=118141 RepID=UPI001863F6AF|nr:UPF0739 protein C1orf74 homolog [Megalops cyprinoides]XP_036390229.1 UPF0739 protein C1orf74 homolog [Megalops cyprinoides]XP_036390230.1 UPF0739 protein C1orf74 homolog [Megalops cyprinoides]